MTESFGELLKQHRRRLRWTQEKLAHEAGFESHSPVSRAEGFSPPSVDVIRKILVALDDEDALSWAALTELASAFLLPDEMRKERGSSPMIGLVVPGVDHSSIWSRMVGAIQEEAARHDYLITFCQHKEDIARQLDLLRYFTDVLPLAGLIIAPAVGLHEPTRHETQEVREVFSDLRKRGLPVVFIDRYVPTRNPVSYIGLDNERAAWLAVTRLVTAKHHRIGGLFALKHSSTQQERWAGYRKALEHHGISYDEDLVRFGEEVDEGRREADRREHGIRRGRMKAKELLSLPESHRPTAIFCGTYYMALEARNALSELHPAGGELPALSLIGFDEVPELDVAQPKITRVAYPVETLAEEAIKRINILIEHGASRDPYAVRLAPSITEKDSIHTHHE